jgi:two-component system, OmpR family, sensor histidine kinase KdpD
VSVHDPIKMRTTGGGKWGAIAVRLGVRAPSGRAYLASVLIAALSDAVAYALFGPNQLTDVIMVLLLGVVIVAMRFGLGPSIVAALLSVLSFDFLFVPPYLSFAVSDLRHVGTFAVMLLVALVISGLTQRVRDQARAAREREERTANLYALTRGLSRTRDPLAVARLGLQHIQNVFEAAAAVWVVDGSGALSEFAEVGEWPALTDHDRALARWALANERAAGLGTPQEPTARVLWIPMIGADRSIGVVGILPLVATRFEDHSWREYGDAFVTQLALALERAQLAQETEQARVQVESEKLRSTLLSSVSHDLRTPLAVITGGASTLLEARGSVDDAVRRELLQTICREGQRLDRLIGNLLEMTRLESGAVRVQKEWQPVEEVVGAALHSLEARLGTQTVVTHLAPDLPLVPLDAILIQQVLINLIENAHKYADGEQPIEIGATIHEGELVLDVADRGAGIEPGQEQKVFDKFYRAPRSAGSGAGLGLAICRGIVIAHGGRISAENRQGGGASFRITLPLGGQPPPIPEASSDAELSEPAADSSAKVAS